MPDKDSGSRGAKALRGRDVRLFTDREDLAADDSRTPEPGERHSRQGDDGDLTRVLESSPRKVWSSSQKDQELMRPRKEAVMASMRMSVGIPERTSPVRMIAVSTQPPR